MASAASANYSKISSVGKRFLTQISSTRVTAAFRKGVHTSVYDKNIDEQVRPTVVPDDAMEAPSDNYWSPHPHTGVFGPTSGHTQGGERSLPSNDGGSTVLEQQAWFRPLENVEKPQEDMEKPL